MTSINANDPSREAAGPVMLATGRAGRERRLQGPRRLAHGRL
jgi:hypothetical protein